MRAFLDDIPSNQCLSEEESEAFKWLIKPEHIREALFLAKNGSATGLDGCPYELWKIPNERSESAHKKERTGFNITETIAIVFQDIQEHGVDERSNFATGWMCPIYKKKDK